MPDDTQTCQLCHGEAPPPPFAPLILSPGAPGEMWVGSEILAVLDCTSSPWAHLRLDEAGWCYVDESGEIGTLCCETIMHYVSLPPLTLPVAPVKP